MNRFAPLLKEINGKLDLPQPVKSRIILELAADLEDLFHHYRSQLSDDEEAMSKVRERLSLDDSTLSALVEVHRPLFKRFMDKISSQAQTWWERSILLLAIAFIAVLCTKTFFTTPFFMRASVFVWPDLVLFLGVSVIALAKTFQLYVKKDHNIRRVRTGISAIAILGLISLFVGVLGYFLELLRAEDKLLFVGSFFNIITATSHRMLVDYTGWIIKSSSMIMFTLFVAIFAALTWFLLSNKAAKIEQAEASILLQD